MDKGGITEAFASKIQKWKWESYSLFGVHSALSEPPILKRQKKFDINKACLYVLGYETMDELVKHFDALYAGDLGQTIGFNACFPSVHNPLLAPPGRCSSQLSMMAPYNLKGARRSGITSNSSRSLLKRVLQFKEYLQIHPG